MQFKCGKQLYVMEWADLVDEKPHSNLNSVISLLRPRAKPKGLNPRKATGFLKRTLSYAVFLVTEQYKTGQKFSGFSHLAPAVASSVHPGSPALHWKDQTGHPQGLWQVAPGTLRVCRSLPRGGRQRCSLSVHLLLLPCHLENCWVLHPDFLKRVDALVLPPENSAWSHVLFHPLDSSRHLFHPDLYLHFLNLLFLPLGGPCWNQRKGLGSELLLLFQWYLL